MSQFHNLLEVEIPHLRRYARALARDKDRADDLVQEALTRALAKQDLWTPGTNLRAWLLSIMHNHHVDIARRPMREAVALEAAKVAGELVAASNPAASCQLHELEKALSQLRQEEREVILLVGLEGKRYDEAAEILGVPIGTVRSRLSCGRDRLRRLMDMNENEMPSASMHWHANRIRSPRRGTVLQTRRAA
jgi:RNA polymerase sigma-70 factor, ECF subfamily